MKLADWLKKAQQEHFALGAFNVDSLEIFEAVAQSGQALKSPVMAEVSPGQVKSLGLQNIAALRENLSEEFGTRIFLNLDHADDLDIINSAIELGFDLVHFDGSKLPLDENMELARQVVEAAHKTGTLVEGEIDHFPGSSEPHSNKMGREKESTDSHLTEPGQAQEFVAETGVDIFAAFIGNKHGTYADGSERLNLEHLTKIRETLPQTFLSLHGGSGITSPDIAAAVSSGIVKVNVSTELRVAFRDTLENILKGNPEEYAWYKLTAPAIEAVREVVEGKIKIFGSAGKAS